MAIPRSPGHRKRSSETIVLTVLHGALAVFTLLVCGVYLLMSLDDPHGECQIHGLNCNRGVHMREGVLIGVVGSVGLLILEFLLMTPQFRKRGWLCVVLPILCCVGQFVLLGVVFLSVPAGG